MRSAVSVLHWTNCLEDTFAKERLYALRRIRTMCVTCVVVAWSACNALGMCVEETNRKEAVAAGALAAVVMCANMLPQCIIVTVTELTNIFHQYNVLS